MKNSFLIFVLLIFLSVTPAFAADSDDYTGSDNTPIGSATKMVTMTTGTVLSVIGGGAFGKKDASIAIKDPSGGTRIFFIDATASIINSAFGVLSLEDIKSGQKVEIEQASTPGGQEKVETVRVID